MKKDEKLVDVEPVRLPSFGPLRPGKYILIFLITVILLAVFLLFFLPGIVKGGRYVTFTSSMSSVGVIIDGEYTGSTSGTNYFIESGSHEAEYIKNGITIGKETLEIDHPVFATLFIRRIRSLQRFSSAVHRLSTLFPHRRKVFMKVSLTVRLKVLSAIQQFCHMMRLTTTLRFTHPMPGMCPPLASGM